MITSPTGINDWLENLGIPADYGINPCRPRYEEAQMLVDAGLDVLSRPQRLAPTAFAAWRAMQNAADADGVTLQPVSCFRSVAYQAELIQRHLQRGVVIDEILKVVAAPGFSEHHTGRAIDLTTPECELLEESFEATPAFAWLTKRAAEFGFVLSYPRNNEQGFIYEPWHWAFWD